MPLFEEWLDRYVIRELVPAYFAIKAESPVKKGEDVYTLEAKRIFQVNHPTTEMRNHAKWLSFSDAYGSIKVDPAFTNSKGIRENERFDYQFENKLLGEFRREEALENFRKEIARAAGVHASMLFGEGAVDEINRRSREVEQTPYSHSWLERKFGHILCGDLDMGHKGHFYEKLRRTELGIGVKGTLSQNKSEPVVAKKTSAVVMREVPTMQRIPVPEGGIEIYDYGKIEADIIFRKMINGERV
jgi:hypothetical protein